MMPTWPSTSLPQAPLVGTLEVTSEPNLSEFKPDVFSSMIRSRRYTGNAEIYNAVLLLHTNEEFDALKRFHRDDCAQGALPFDMNDWVDGESRQFMWISPPTFAHMAFGIWRASVQLVKLPQAPEEAFSPADLFVDGDDRFDGFWFEPADITTLFQTAAGTTPVTADNDPVGFISDKSGNGNHASRLTADANRALYRTALPRLQFDGTNDAYTLLNSLAMLQNCPKWSMCFGASVNDNAADKYLFCASTTAAATVRTALRLSSTEAIVVTGRRLDADGQVAITGSVIATGTPKVLSSFHDYANARIFGRINGIYDPADSTWQTAGNTSNTASNNVQLGAQNGGTPWLGDIYFAMGIRRELAETQWQQLEDYVAGLMGISI